MTIAQGAAPATLALLFALAATAPAAAAAVAEGAPAAPAATGDGTAATGTGARFRDAPLWELGVGAAALQLPHYRGSEQSHSWLLAVPYAVYRGRFLRADREGARAVLLERSAFEVDLSLAGSAPVRSEDNRARQGMPGLAPTVEFGPNATLTLARGSQSKVELRVPVRAAFTVQRSSRAIGWTTSPYVTAEWKQGGWDLGVRAGGLWGDRRLNGYTYDVPSEFATATRPAYRAGSGYAGWQLTAGASRRFESLWLGGFLRADSVEGAVFAGSPLVTRRSTWSAGIALSWIFARSAVLVRVPD
ncbi:MAG: MipA/OmpV family protein [Rubrivivax sp.]|nr:MipA/OmpV family protein [Rubrivivax sp.]